MSRILIVDDDRALGRSLEIQLGSLGHAVRCAQTGADGLAACDESPPDAVLLDLNLPDRSGLEVLAEILERRPGVPVAMITGQQDMKATIEAMRAGAIDYIRKPFDLDDVLLLIEKVQRLSRRPASAEGAPALSPLHAPCAPPPEARREIVGADKRITEALKQIGLLARSRVTVLIEGESGTGKELVARALHEAASPGEPFVAINCSAVVPTLLESELFGHEKGAFTGADARKIGKLEFAGAGTLFLDEVGDMPPDLQAKLLRVLQEESFERVGGLEPVPYRARTVAATHRDLNRQTAEGKFREDLYYRLAVSRIELPPLRERRGDIPLLAAHLAARIAASLHRSVAGIDEAAVDRLRQHDWPGNVRELENVLTRAIALSQGDVVTSEDLERSFWQSPGTPDRKDQEAKTPTPDEIVPLREAEKRHIAQALRATNRNITQTARLLEISPTTLRKKIGDYGL